LGDNGEPESFRPREPVAWPFNSKPVYRLATGLKVRLAVVLLLLPGIVVARNRPGPAEAQALEAQGRLDEAAQMWRSLMLLQKFIILMKLEAV
jgi:hypothetical protein